MRDRVAVMSHRLSVAGKPRKRVYYECPICRETYRSIVSCEIKGTRLVPYCEKCLSSLIRRVEKKGVNEHG